MRANFFSLLDPRPRLLCLLAAGTLFFLPLQVWVYGVLVFLLLASALADQGARAVAGVFRSIGPILILVILFTPPFFPQGRVIFSLGNWVILSSRGIVQTLILVFRFSGLTLLFFLFYRATGSQEFLSCLRWYRLPFSAALVLSLALRAIPELFGVYRQVKDAHSLRERPGAGEAEKTGGSGGSDGSGGYAGSGKPPNPGKSRGAGGSGGGGITGGLRRLRLMVPHLTSVFIVTVKKIPPLAMSLQLRGAGAVRGRSLYFVLPGRKKCLRDFLIFFLLLAIMVILLVKLPFLWYNGSRGIS